MNVSPSSAGLRFESEFRHSLKKIGFKHVGGGPDFRVGGHQIDACGGWDDALIVFECQQSTSGNASIRDLISELRGKQGAIKQGFRKLATYSTYTRFVFAIVTRNIRVIEDDRKIAAHRPPVHLLDAQAITYYQKLASLIGERGALFNFLGELKVEPRDVDLPKVPAFRVQLDRSLHGYLFWCEPHQLLKIAYVARRDSGREKYYQRMLTQQRLRKIEGFIQKGGMFPNNIIVAFDRRPTFRPKPRYDERWPGWLEFGELAFPPSYRSCWVIDGQHRLYAFGRLAPNPKLQQVAVFAFEPIPEHKQASFFIQINKEQKPVSLDLIWDLEGEMSPDTPRGEIANCVKQLNSMPPLSGKIFMPLSGERKHGQLKMSGVCQDIEDVGLLRDRTRNMRQDQKNPLAHTASRAAIPGRAANAVASYLSEVNSLCSEALWGGLLMRPGGITVALDVYEQVLITAGRVPTIEQLKKYTVAFVGTLKEIAPSEAEIRRFVKERLTSYAQRRQVSEEILDRMQERLGDREFASQRKKTSEPFADRLVRFERRLAEFVVDRLGLTTIEQLKQKAPEGIWKQVEDRTRQQRKSGAEPALHEELTLGETKEILARSDNAKLLMPTFTDTMYGFGSEQAVIAGLSGIMQARNVRLHGRRKVVNRRLVTAYLETFERAIGT